MTQAGSGAVLNRTGRETDKAGELITKGESISRLADFGVPPRLAHEIRRRRKGEQVELSSAQRSLRARTARRIMAAACDGSAATTARRGR